MNSEKIAVKKYLQSTGLCGPASLKILLSHFGKDFSESDLAGLASAAAGLERGMGTEHEGMINAAKESADLFLPKTRVPWKSSNTLSSRKNCRSSSAGLTR